MSKSVEGERFGYSERRDAEGRQTAPGLSALSCAPGSREDTRRCLEAEWWILVLQLIKTSPLSLSSWKES